MWRNRRSRRRRKARVFRGERRRRANERPLRLLRGACGKESHDTLAKRGFRRQTNRPARSFVAKTQGQIHGRQGTRTPLRPFHEDDGARFGKAVQAQPLQLTRVGNAIQIQMEGLAFADVVALDKAIGRTLDPFTGPQRLKKGAGERGLACAEVPVEKRDQALGQGGCQVAPQGHGGFLVGEEQLDVAHASSPLTRRRSGSSRSPASNPRSPSRAATSPARACNPTPTQAASKASQPWPISAAMIPVRVSPMPPLAMPGLPQGQTATSPVGDAIRLPLPLRTTTAWKRRAISRTAAKRSACTALVSMPSRRPAS